MLKKRVVVSVISDLVSDQRVHKVCMYLQNKGYHVNLIGRRFKESLPVKERTYHTERLLCYFRRGILQYAEFNLKLFLSLMQKQADLFVANDLDTLVPNYLQATWRRKKLVYDSHEYFTGTPELQYKPLKKKIWKTIEAWLLPKIKYSYTVNTSIAELYKKEYGIEMKVVRNVPVCKEESVETNVPSFPTDKFILLLQGAGINRERGAEEVIESMQLLPPQFFLLLIGGGDVWQELQQKTTALKLNDRICFVSKVPFSVLQAYTKQAHLGLSLDKPTCLNHQLMLPNKIFDYLRAGVPVLASNLIEVKHVVEQYNVGMCLSEVTPHAIATAVLRIYNDKTMYERWKQNTRLAAGDFCWEKEQHVLDKIFAD